MLRLTKTADAADRPQTLPEHMHLCGRDVLLMSTPLRDEMNWWWTCNPDFNTRSNPKKYSQALLSMPHKIGADPRVKSDFPPELPPKLRKQPSSRQLPPMSQYPSLPLEPESCPPPVEERKQVTHWASNRNEWAAGVPSQLWSTDIRQSTNKLIFSRAPARAEKVSYSPSEIAAGIPKFQPPDARIKRAGTVILHRSNSFVKAVPTTQRSTEPGFDFYSTSSLTRTSRGLPTLVPMDHGLAMRRTGGTKPIEINAPKMVSRFPVNTF